MRALGISAFYHDSAAALVEDGRIVAAAQEERFTRKKHDSSFPKNAIAYCFEEAGARLDELDHVVFYDKPFLKFERLLETYLAFAPRGFRSFRMAILLWLKEKLFQKSLLKGELKQFADGFDSYTVLLSNSHDTKAGVTSEILLAPIEEAARCPALCHHSRQTLWTSALL
jgi:carbamoyltransferase